MMRFSLLLCAGGLAVALAGCGTGSTSLSNQDSVAGTSSGSGSRKAGRAVLTIQWPQSAAVGASRASRLIPAATQSIKVTLFDSSGAQVGSKAATRPTTGSSSAIAFDNLLAGVLHVEVAAFPTADATGTILASGNLDVTITSGQVTNASLSLASTIEHLAVGYTAPDLLAGETQTITATAYDAAGSVVLLTPGALAWTSSDPAKATVASTSAGAALTGVGAGTTIITVTDTESHVTASFPVQGMTFAVTPAAASLPVNGTQALSAALAGLSDTSVAYSLVDAHGATVANGGAGGSIDAQGHYAAPATPGTCYVRVTSLADPKRFVDVKLHIMAGNAGVTVQ